MVRRSTENVEAYDLYLRGRYFWSRRARDDLLKAIDYFEQAIKLDPGYALAYSGLTDVYVIGSSLGTQVFLPAKEAWPKAEAAALQAIQLDPNLAETHTSMAKVLEEYRRDFPAAEAEYRRAIGLNPQYALAHAWYGYLLGVRMQTRFDQAVEEGKEALRRDPLSPTVNSTLGEILKLAGRYDEAIPYLRTAIDLEPDWPEPWWRLAEVYVAKGMLPQALATYQRRVAIARPPTARDSAGLAHLYARTGNRTEALKILDLLREASRTQDVWQPLAIVYAGLGDHDRAFQALERARERGVGFTRITNNRLYDSLRSDPRFAEFVRKVGWEP